MKHLALALMLAAGPALAQEPSFDCAAAESTGERAVCADPALAELDVELARLYAAASDAPGLEPEEAATLRAMQRGWIKGRDDCWKSETPSVCVRDAYAFRIHELRASSEAARAEETISRGPFLYDCEGAVGQVRAVFLNGETPLLSLKDGDSWHVLPAVVAASGARYATEGLEFWEKGETARLTRAGAASVDCRRASEANIER